MASAFIGDWSTKTAKVRLLSSRNSLSHWVYLRRLFLTAKGFLEVCKLAISDSCFPFLECCLIGIQCFEEIPGWIVVAESPERQTFLCHFRPLKCAMITTAANSRSSGLDSQREGVFSMRWRRLHPWCSSEALCVRPWTVIHRQQSTRKALEIVWTTGRRRGNPAKVSAATFAVSTCVTNGSDMQ